MADSVQLKTTGLQECLRTLERMPAEISQRNGGPVKRALAKVARSLAKRISAAAPVKTGALRDSIKARRGKPGKGEPNGEIYLVGPKPERRRYADSRVNRRKGRAKKVYLSEGKYFYARFSEFGTKYQPATHWMERSGSSAAAQVIADGQSALLADVEKTMQRIYQEEGGR